LAQCEILIHLAGINRHEDESKLFDENISLTRQLITVVEKMAYPPRVLFSSSTQEYDATPYGLAKKKCRELWEEWSIRSGNRFTGMIIPNVFGPFGKPFYNSFIATFCYQLNKGETPVVHINKKVSLIYVSELIDQIINWIEKDDPSTTMQIQPTHQTTVIDVLNELELFQKKYLINGVIPDIRKKFTAQLFNTFRSFMDYATAFPKKYICHNDNRGSFVELIRLDTGGQVSFSTTMPGVTRGNHFHTRKAERFSVISGKAKMELRRFGHEETITYILDGNQPAYVDIPVWYYHNLTNIGDDILYTIFSKRFRHFF
jgi:UDP-2-acetamido-2,6-beta-L-arabino-hexul-4-ose reductase